MQYRIGIDVDDLHQIEVKVTYKDWAAWVSAAEYALEYVQACHPNTTVELAYVKEFDYD